MSSTTQAQAITNSIPENFVPLGLPVPPHTPHAISVSLPTWRDNVGYEEGDKRVVDSMVSGYPRFFIHLSIVKLASYCEQKYSLGNERCMLFPTQKVAEHCRQHIQKRKSSKGTPLTARLLHLFVCSEDNLFTGANPPANDGKTEQSAPSPSTDSVDLHIVFFDADTFPVAKEFWQHTGMGISSRLAEKCLSVLSDDTLRAHPISPNPSRFPTRGHNRHYSVKTSKVPLSPVLPSFEPSTDDMGSDHNVYLEERYGRNLPLSAAASAKRALRRRIAGVLIHDNPSDSQGEPDAGQKDLPVGPSTRGVKDVSEDDVYLYQTGMAAIWNAHNLASEVRPIAKSICFGFPYTDTLKILQKWGPGCHFYGHGLDSDIDNLEAMLIEQANLNPGIPPILALFVEFPSNPLLRSSDLARLRALADKYDFLIVIDETIGNFVNVEVLPFADIVVSSLTKVFSGTANVMGGSLVLNPQGRHYTALKTHLSTSFEDLYFNEDAIYMERNSRDFKRRIRVIDSNAEAVCDYLHSRSLGGGATSAAIKQIFYPKFTTPDHYERHRIKSGYDGKIGGFGGLFSLTFISDAASKAFFDALLCYKGPSLGTNFTLASPFTILAHFTELEWAAQYGVESGLVRVGVGMEETNTLLGYFKIAVETAEATVNVA